MKNARKLIITAITAALLLSLCSCSLSDLFGMAGITSPQTEAPVSPATTAATEPIEEPDDVDLTKIDLTKYMSLEYKGIELTTTVEQREITEAIIDTELEGIMVYYGYYELDTSRKAEFGDMVEISYRGYLDGAEFDGGTSDKTTLVLDDSQSGFITGFAEGIIGTKPGDTVKLNLTFPENYYESLAGLPVVFEITLKGICSCTLTDEIAGKLSNGEHNTVAAFRSYLKTYLEKLDSYDTFNDVYSSIWTKLEEAAVINSIPEELESYYYQTYINAALTYSQSYGISYDEYMAYLGYTDADVRTMAQDTAKSQMITYYIANAEGVTMTDDIYQSYLENIVSNYNSQGYSYSADEIESMYESYYGEGYLAERAFEEKLSYIVFENAKITYKAAE